MIKNPVMFVTMVGAAVTTVGIFTGTAGERGFILQLAIWLWFTVLFANFAEAVAEGRGKAQAESLRKARKKRPRADGAMGERKRSRQRNCKKAIQLFAKQVTSSRRMAR